MSEREQTPQADARGNVPGSKVTPATDGLTVAEADRLAVLWYEKHGRHKGRIKRGPRGRRFVQSDWAWNHNHRHAREAVDYRIANFIAYRQTGLR